MKPLILLVDDNEDMLLFLKTELIKLYDLLFANDGNEALALLSSEPVKLIVSDIMMDGMDGIELCKKVKNTVGLGHIPFILLTAKNSLQSKIEGLEIGADAYIEKPFSPEFLRVQIANLLDNRLKLKAFFAHAPIQQTMHNNLSRSDEYFIEKLQSLILTYIEDVDLDVDRLAKDMNMSRPTLYRNVKSIVGMSPLDFITTTRLKKAAELLLEGNYKVYEVADLTGFASQTNFGRNFSKHYGMTPSEYIAKGGINNA